MSGPQPQPASASREQLIALLAERAAVLAPSDELINRALRRCVRHDLRAKTRSSRQGKVGEATPGPLPEVSPTSAGPALPVTEPDPAGRDHQMPLEPIATAVAKAHTVAEEPSDMPPPTPAPAPPASDGAPQVISQAPAAIDQETGKVTRILAPGTPLGGYRIESLIGVGGMGQVYRATQVSMNRQVALKVLLPRFTKNPRFRERFLREARAAGRLHHPNLIAVHDVGEDAGLLFFSMELVEGTSIKQLIAELGTIAEDRALDIARQTLEALRYAHERGIIHRDIKPDNLMLTSTGMVKVADLGLSRSDNDEGGDQFTTQTGTMMGTPFYMPPEQGRDAHRADLRADLYAVGATLYHMVCGRVPFDGDSAVAILIAASTQPLSFPDAGPSPAVRRFLEKLMAKKPAERPQSASDALAMIRNLHLGPQALGPAPTAAAPTPSGRGPAISGRLIGRARRRRRIRRAGIGLVVVLALAVLAIGAWWEWRHGPARDLKRSVAELEASHRYAAALGQIELAAERHPRDAWLCQKLREQVNGDWDAWARNEARPVFERFDAALGAGKLDEADAALNQIDESWRSPALLGEIERREKALDEARARMQPADERRAMLQTLIDGWVRQLFTGKAAIANGRVVLMGSNNVVFTPPVVRNRSTNLPIELIVQGPLQPGEVVLHAAPGIDLHFTGSTAELTRGTQKMTLARADAQGRITVTIHRRGTDVELLAADGVPGSGIKVTNASGPVLEWRIQSDRRVEIALAVSPLVMRRPPDHRDTRPIE